MSVRTDGQRARRSVRTTVVYSVLPFHVHPRCGIIIQRWLWPSALHIAIITDTTACSKVSPFRTDRKIDPAFRSSQKVCGVIFGIWKVYKTATRAAARALTRSP